LTEVRKARGAYGSGKATKESILVAATELFGEKGYYGFSLRDVAKIVGISHPAVIYHFPTKETLLFSTVARWHKVLGIDSVRVNPGTGETEVERMPQLYAIGIALLRLGSREDFSLLARFDSTMATEAVSPSHPLFDHYQMRMSALQELITERVISLTEEGWCNPLMSPSAVATSMISSWYGLQVVDAHSSGLQDGQAVVGWLMATSIRLLKVDSEGLLAMAAAVPEELAAPFQRALKVNRELSA